MRQGTSPLEIVSGWKDIANYLGKGVRTVQRYERELSLPVRRPAKKTGGSVIATKPELDAWVKASPTREEFHLPRPPFDNAGLLTEFRQNVSELHRLREETKVLREQLHISLELLRASLRFAVPVPDRIPSSKRRLLADVLTFNPAKKKAN